jgi:cell division septum initiation protein DivIVA
VPSYADSVTDAERLLADAEEKIEAWLCELDGVWKRILDDGRAEADTLVRGARAEATAIVGRARADASAIFERAEAEIVGRAQAQARTIIERAEAESASLLGGSAHLAAIQLAEAQVRVDDLAALGTAVQRLRVELSRVVDAAFDALPAVEATVAALNLDEPIHLPEPEPVQKRKRKGFKRLLRI